MDSLRRALEGDPIRVGTENRAKLAAVRGAFAGFAEDPSRVRVVAVGVPSGVPEQPVGWRQIVLGACNRARAALASEAADAAGYGDPAIAVGIEDGLVRLSDEPDPDTGDPDLREWFNVGCAWITDGRLESHGFSSGFAYPPEVLLPALREQAPIGDLFDDHWSRHRPVDEAAKSVPSGRRGGNIGRLTGGRLDRAAYGKQAVTCALVRFLHGDLYD